MPCCGGGRCDPAITRHSRGKRGYRRGGTISRAARRTLGSRRAQPQETVAPEVSFVGAARPDHYRQFDVLNGWGTYDDFVPWLERYLEACREHLEAEIWVSR